MIDIMVGRNPVQLDPEIKYLVYGEDVMYDTIMDMDFEHLNWLDQRVVAQSLRLNNEISILFHPEVTSSVDTEFENSPYWQKTRFEALAIFRRLQQSRPESVEAKMKRKMSKEVDLASPKITQKRFRLVNNLVVAGYDRADAKDYVAGVIETRGSGVMNLTLKEIAALVDEFVGITDEPKKNGTQYFKKDSQKPCTIYYLKFTHKETGEEFKKIGITVRPLRERFYMDMKIYDLEIIHTSEMTAEKAQIIEDKIKRDFEEYKYIPKKKLKKGGHTECFFTSLEDAPVIEMMGRNKVM